jgi:hypothetical protein
VGGRAPLTVTTPAGEADRAAPRWLYAVYAAVWVFGIVAALFALLGVGGFKVAALAIVPLVLLAPTALYGIRLTLHRAPNQGSSSGHRANAPSGVGAFVSEVRLPHRTTSSRRPPLANTATSTPAAATFPVEAR